MVTQTSSFEQEPISIEEILSANDAYIQQCVRLQFRRDRRIPVEVLDLEMDDLVQQARVKLWKALQKRKIVYARSYIRKIVANVITDMARGLKKRSTIPLVLDEEEENYVQYSLFGASLLVPDLADEYEEYDQIVDILEQTIEQAVTFPARQQLALLCRLKEHFEGESYLVQILEEQGLDAEVLFWPEEEREKQCLKASLPAARKRLELVHETILR